MSHKATASHLLVLLVTVSFCSTLVSAGGRHLLQSCSGTPCVTITAPTAGAAFNQGGSVQVQAVANGVSITRVDFYVASNANPVGCKLGSSSGPTFVWTWSNVPAGNWLLYAQVIDNHDTANAVASSKVAIQVSGTVANVVPYVSLTSPIPRSTFTAPANISIAATACDIDGYIKSVVFNTYSQTIATAYSSPYTAYLPVASPATINIYAIATDDKSAPGVTSAVQVSIVSSSGVSSPPPQSSSHPLAPAPPPANNGGCTSGGITFVLTVNGGTGSGTFAQYQDTPITANPAPAGQVFDYWIVNVGQPFNIDAFNYKTSIQSKGSGCITVTASYKVDVSIPFPVSSHPRLLITQANISTLQSWASSSNPMYTQGLQPALASAISHTDKAWSWTYNGGTGKPNLAIWMDTGGDSWEGDITEAYALMFAFASIINSNAQYASRAKDMFMWIIHLAAVNGPTGNASLPFGSVQFATFNRASHYGDSFGLVYDWLQWWGPSFFSNAEKVLVRQVFLMWAAANMNGYMHPTPVGMINNPQLLANTAHRNVVNNYASAHFRQLAFMSLSFDPADDGPVDPNMSIAYIGNSIRSYISDATGAYLYDKYACMEVPSQVAADLGVPVSTPGLGCMSGGLSPEGFLYGASLAYVHTGLTALHTAGWNNAALSGPQIKLISSTWWDRFLAGFLHSLTPAPFTPTASSGYGYMGQVWQMFNYGDNLRLWIDPPAFDVFASIGWLERSLGNTARLQTAQWIGVNVLEGGAAKLFQRAANPWPNGYAFSSIMYFLLYDPQTAQGFASNANYYPDPRPSLSTLFYDNAINRILARTNWSPSARVFTYKCTWNQVNHQLADCGQFEFYRNGEYLTKEDSGYATDDQQNIGGSSVLHNTLALQNSCNDPNLSQPVNLQPDEKTLFALGSQQAEGFVNGGDPTTNASFTSGYVHASSEFHGLYNRPSPFSPGNAAIDVKHSSRTIVWLRNDYIVIYDRATTGNTGKFKRFNMNFIASMQPTVNGPLITSTTPKGQLLFVTSLLPQNGTISVQPIPNWKSPAQLEPTTHYMVVQDPTMPANVRFLHVLQAADVGSTPVVAQTITGSVNGGVAGTMDGALFGTYAVIFIHDISSGIPVTSLTYTLPAGAAAPATTIVTGLVPGASYLLVNNGGFINISRGTGGSITDNAGVAQF